MRPFIGRGESVARWQARVRAAAVQRYRARVTRRHVAIRVVGGDRHGIRRACRDGRGKAADRQCLRRSRLHVDLRLGTRDGRRRRVGRCDRLRPGGIERDREATLARVDGGESVARRQGRVRVAAGQGHRAGITRRHVAIRVIGSDHHFIRCARRDCRGKAGNRQCLRRSRSHRDPQLGARNARRHRVGRRDQLRPGSIERDGEAVLARGGGGEGVARRQGRVRVAAGQGYRARVSGRHVAIRIVGRDDDITGRSRRIDHREAGERESLRSRRLHRDSRLRGRDARGGICHRHRLRPAVSSVSVKTAPP